MKKLAFVFPGQGSRAIGMLNGFADHPVGWASFISPTYELAGSLAVD